MPRTHSHTSVSLRIAAGPSWRRRRPEPFRPRLEYLEGREAPAVFEVTTTDDGGPGSLRQAVLDANANQEDDFILLGAATYQLSIAGAGEDLGQTGDLDVRQGTVWVIGAGAGATVIDAAGLDRAFHVLSATVILDRLTVSGGQVTGNPGRGGGIYVAGGGLYLFASALTGNSARGGDPPRDNAFAGFGGGLYVAGGGNVLLYGSAISGNEARGGSAYTYGTGGSASGGGAYIENGNMLLFGSTVASNSAIGGAGGVGRYSAGFSGGAAAGGSLFLAGGWLQVNGSVLVNNRAMGGAGGPGAGGGPQGYPGGPGGNGSGGGVFINKGAVEIHGSYLTANQATGGSGGAGGPPGGPPGAPGAGIGGGLYIVDGPETHMCIDLDSVILGNLASTSDPDIFGPWEPC